MPIATNSETGDVLSLGADGQWAPAQIAVNPETKERMAFDGQAWVTVAPHGPPAASVGSVAKQFGVGAAKEAIAAPAQAFPVLGATEHISEAARAGLVKAAKAAGYTVPEVLDQPLPTTAGLTQAAIEKVTGPFRKAENLPERLAETAGGFTAGAAAGPGGPLRAAARGAGAIIPALLSQGAAELPGVAGSKYEALARLLGAGAGIGGMGALRMAGAPIAANIRARVDPAGFAGGQVGRIVDESRVNPAAVEAEIAGAQAEGQPMFTVADALGNAGQRGLSSVARAPGQGRTDVVNFLEGRQGGQAGRVSNALAEGFDAPQTAEQARTRLTEARDTAADQNYGAVRHDANPVDLTGAIARIDETLQPGATRLLNPGTNIADDTVESVLRRVRDRLTDDRSNLTDFTAVQRVRGDLSDMAQSAQQQGHGNRARLLRGVLREIDTAMENASAGHLAANRQFAAGSRAIESVGEGTTAAQRGRPEDVIQDFQGRPADQQAAFRTGYADPLIEQAQSAAFGANKARPLTSEAFGREAAAMAPGAPVMARRLGRENTMFETRRQATGGSQTADNLADAAATGLNPVMVANAVMGNAHGVARGLLHAGANMLTGNTPAVRAEIARILLMRGENATPANIRRTLEDLHRVEIARQIHRRIGTYAPLAVAGAQSNAP